MAKYKKYVVLCLLFLELITLFLTFKSFSNRNIDEIKETYKVDKKMFAMYTENENGTYSEYTSSNYFPTSGYIIDLEKSNCVDNKGNKIEGILTGSGNKITVSSNKTLFCYLYFDLDKVAPQSFTFYLGGSSNPEYITSTSTTTYLSWTDTDITSYCINTENDSSSCSWTDTGGNEVSASYTISTQGSQTRYAFIRDAAENISPVVSDEVFLDSVAPVITSASDSEARTANVTVTETGSGVQYVCVNTRSSSTTGCTWDEVSGTTFTSTTEVTATGNYYIHVKDKAGNIGHSSNSYYIKTLPVTLHTLCSSYTNMGICMASEYGSTKMQEISNIGEDAGMYRFQGTYDVVDNNYICFGTTSKTECTGNTDAYMYRIIGVNSTGQMKLIKKEALNTTVKWWSDYATDVAWPDSLIYTVLNENDYLLNATYIPSGWKNKIATHSWKYGDTTSDGNYDGATIYAIENAWTNIVSAKVGLMYIHDYYYAYAAGGAPGSNSNAKTAWIHLSANDSGAPSSAEWTMSRYVLSGKGYRAWYVLSSGLVNHYYLDTAMSVRPVFYLTSDVEITGGVGISTDPYIMC